MKTFHLTLLAVLTICMAPFVNSKAFADVPDPGTPQVEEVPVLNVHIAREGFDDNDNVQMVVRGELPDPCYTLGKTRYQIDSNTKTIRVHQYAWRRMDGACASGDLVEGPSPYDSEVSMGILKAGQYRIQFTGEANATLFKTFQVSQAPATTIDSLNYPNVSNIIVDDILWSTDSIKVTLTGTFSNGCTDLEGPTRIQNLGDTIVILPVQSTASPGCTIPAGSFKREIELGKLDPGTYLLHIRSRNGRAVNRIFTVRAYPSPAL